MGNYRKFLLVACVAGLSVTYQQVNAHSNLAVSVVQQQKGEKIVGIVVDSQTNEVVPGAAVQIKGTHIGVITDVDGKFEIIASRGQVLIISYLGYTPKEIEIGNQKVLTITLSEDAELLDEVVVTAFGTGQKKESVTGSIQSVRPTDLKVPSANLSTSFAGRLAGVVSYQRSGMPGSNGSDFFIRGISTLSSVTSPLIILDGMEVASADLNALDSEVIESFSILKDATATAMYGTRGANGVMIIKTKSGADLDKPIIGVRVEANVTTPTSKPEFVDAMTYMNMFNEAVTSQGTGDALYTSDKIYGTMNSLDSYVYPNVDWYDELMKNMAFNQRANFNIRGGTQRITYFMNMNFSHETGMLKNRSQDYFSYKNNIDLKKYTFQNNIDFHMSKSSTIGLHLNAQIYDQTGPATSFDNIYSLIMKNNPADYPVMYPKSDTENWIRWGGMTGTLAELAQNNPVAAATNGYSDTFWTSIIANLDFTQKLDFITPGLSFKAMISLKNWSQTTRTRSQAYNSYYLNSYTQNPDGTYSMEVLPVYEAERHTLGTSNGTTGDRRFYAQAYLDYTRSFGDHNVNAMVLWNQDQFDSNAPGDLISSLPKRKIGFAGRLSYDYAHRYMLELNAGYNGSENFAEGHRYGFFPSVSAGWNLSEEKFWEPLKSVVSNLKLRGSYGLVGNDQIGDARFLYLAQVNLQGTGGYRTGYGTQTQSYSGPVYSRYQNNDITWEVGRKLNVGMDIQLFNSLNITLDGFQEIRSDIFQQRGSIPNYLGTAGTVIYGNLAKVKNWGFDMSVDYGKQITKDFSMQFRGTFTFARNRVLEYDEAPGLRPALSQIGKSLNTYWGYVADGLYIDAGDITNNATSTIGNIAIAPGDIKYVDQPDANGNYDGKITSDDQVNMGYPTVPEIVYGFGPSMQWKRWDFSFFFQGQANVSLMMSNMHPFGTNYHRNVLSWIAEDYWSENNQNTDATYPRLTKYDNNHNTANSTFWLRNAAFLKLKNLELGYSYKNMRLYFSATNLLTFSPFDLWDPEMGGGAGLKYPTQRTFNLGFQITFNK